MTNMKLSTNGAKWTFCNLDTSNITGVNTIDTSAAASTALMYSCPSD